MKNFISIVLLCISQQALGFLDRYKAVTAYEKKDFTAAQTILKQQLVSNSGDPELLFDLGDASYRLQEFDQAQAYFAKAFEKTKDPILQQKALFNAGNTCVHKKQLKEAIEQYKKVLVINPANKDALHNKKVVEELLREQEEQKKKEEEQKKQQEKDKEEQQKDNDQQDQGDDSKDQDKDQQEQKEDGKKDSQESGKKDGQQKKDQQGKGDQKNKPEDKGQQDDAKKSLEEKIGEQEGKQGGDEQKEQQVLYAQPADPADEEKDEVARVIDKIDGESGKQLFRYMVKTKMEPKYGQKNW